LENEEINTDNIPTFEKKHIPVAIVLTVCFAYMMYLGVRGKITLKVSGTLFIYMGFLAGVASRMNPNKMSKVFVKGAKGMAGTAMMIGFAYGITKILNAGGIMDTIVYNLAQILNYVPRIFQAPAMFLMHIVINFFITSGSGQAAATMGFVGMGNIPFTRWFKFAIKLFGVWVVVGCILLMIATVIGY